MKEVILIDETTALHRADLERFRLCSVFLCSRINIYEPEKGPEVDRSLTGHFFPMCVNSLCPKPSMIFSESKGTNDVVEGRKFLHCCSSQKQDSSSPDSNITQQKLFLRYPSQMSILCRCQNAATFPKRLIFQSTK